MELDDLLECSVCLESLGPDHRVLPCQHTFCTTCLSDVAAKYARLKSSSNSATLLLCPECRAPCQVALHLLPTNIILNRILAAKQAPKNSQNFAPRTPITSSSTNSNFQMSISALASPTKDVFGLATSFNALNPFLNPQSSNASSTNIDVLATISPSGSASTTPTNSWMAESITSATSNETLSAATGASVASSPPPVLPPKSSSAFPLPPSLPARPQSAPVLDALNQSNRKFCQYRALYDYKPVQKDELKLVKNDLLIVTEKCADGWFKGYNINDLESGRNHTCTVGVFPGNYVREINESDNNGRVNPTAQSGARMQLGEVDDEEELDLFGCTKTFGIQPQARGSSRPSEPSASSTSRTISHSSSVQSNLNGRHQGQKYRCVVAFPASSDYELDLRQGDVVYLTTRRDDGWCQGWQERTNKNGLFPSSFVVKM